MQEHLAEESIETLLHPSYSLDFASCDFFAIPTSEEMLRRKKFQVSVSPRNCCFPVFDAYTPGGLSVSISTMDWATVEMCGSRGML